MKRTRRVVIMGAGGRDFHNFNVYFKNRPEYATKNRAPAATVQSGTIRLNLGETGTAGKTLLTWPLAASWDSGPGWRTPQKSLGKQKVYLHAGRHKLIMFFDGFNEQFTFFCKLVFTPWSVRNGR